MRIFMTGGTGNVGVAAVRRLISAGHQVTVVGRRDATVPEGTTYHRCDISDFSELYREMQGHDAVVHLAAIPSPHGRPGREVFHSNAQGTFNVYEAAAEHAISRVVSASSINALGLFFGDRTPPIHYLPVDEEHPVLATDAYSFAKQIAERIGSYFYERDRITGVSLRLPGVISQETAVQWLEKRGAGPSATVRSLLELSDKDRLRELARLHRLYEEHRTANRLDKIQEQYREGSEQQALTEEERRHMSQHVNLYAYIHEDDSAQAIELAVTQPYDGHHVLFVNAAQNSAGLPRHEVQKLFWPQVESLREDHADDTCIPSIAAARTLLGFDPRFSFKGRERRG